MRTAQRASLPSKVLSFVPKAAKSGPILALAVTAGAAGVIYSQDVKPVHAEPAQTVQTPYGRAPLSFADLIEKVKPSVVSVAIVNDGSSDDEAGDDDRERGGGLAIPDLPEDHPLHDFFKNLPRQFGQPNRRGRPRIVRGQGSGFVISEDGYVVTNNHVIDGATSIELVFDDGQKHKAKLVGKDLRTDLALLKIDSDKKFTALKFAETNPRVGDWALAVGNPFGLGGSVTAGIVSALARDIGSGPYDYMQIDAAVNRGNSGGPTFNLDGEVIGVNTAIYSPSGGNVGIAFAVPANTAKNVIAELKKSGMVSRGWLGVKIQNIDDDTAASLGLKKAQGALVSEINPTGPAAAAGVKVSDAILEVNGDKVEDSRDLARRIAEFSPDTSVDLTVWRGDGEKTIPVKLGLFPTNPEMAMRGGPQTKPEKKSNLEFEQLGLTLMPARSEDDDEDGVVIAEITPGSDAALKGLKPGDVILEVSGELVRGPEDVAEGIRKARDLDRSAVLLHIKSSDQKRFVAVQLKDKKG